MKKGRDLKIAKEFVSRIREKLDRTTREIIFTITWQVGFKEDIVI
jgi:hypothetical protein